MKKNIVLAVLLALSIAGCGERKIDGSSQAAFDKSIDPIIKKLPKEEAKEVFGGMSRAIMSETVRLKGKGNPYQIFDGMTESEFISFAKSKNKPRKK